MRKQTHIYSSQRFLLVKYRVVCVPIVLALGKQKFQPNFLAMIAFLVSL